MTARILIDMNLSPTWVEAFTENDIEAVHWSEIGDPKAQDTVIMAWAREHGFIVFTNDLDFGTLLALTHDSGPSVIQVKGQDLMPDHLAPMIMAAVAQHASDLKVGAILVIEESKNRVRILPI